MAFVSYRKGEECTWELKTGRREQDYLLISVKPGREISIGGGGQQFPPETFRRLPLNGKKVWYYSGYQLYKDEIDYGPDVIDFWDKYYEQLSELPLYIRKRMRATVLTPEERREADKADFARGSRPDTLFSDICPNDCL